MKNILEEIAARTRERIAKEKSCISVSELENRIQEVNKNAGQKITFFQALQKDGMSYICEVKKASPSKGLIAPDVYKRQTYRYAWDETEDNDWFYFTKIYKNEEINLVTVNALSLIHI